MLGQAGSIRSVLPESSPVFISYTFSKTRTVHVKRANPILVQLSELIGGRKAT